MSKVSEKSCQKIAYMYFTDQNAYRREFSTKLPDNMKMLIKSLILTQTTQNLVRTLIIGDTCNLY